MTNRYPPWLLLIIVLVSCQAATPPAPTGTATFVSAVTATITPTLPQPGLSESNAATATPVSLPIPDYAGVNNRVADATEQFFNPLLARDAIRPVYEPQFAPAGAVDVADEELVMGVAWGNEAKAYPVTVMRIREMVNDELAGIPILVTW